MVLWEITAITAYFLGLKRTYKLALRIQRRLIKPNHPKIRDFVYRRTRNVFNIAVSVHKNIQERDLEAGRNIGSMILKWLDRMKPSAQIRPHHHLKCDGSDRPKLPFPSLKKPNAGFKASDSDSKSNGRVMFSPLDIRSKVLPSVMISNVIRQGKLGGVNSCHFRRLSYYACCNNGDYLGVERKREVFQGVFRKDIMEFMMRP